MSENKPFPFRIAPFRVGPMRYVDMRLLRPKMRHQIRRLGIDELSKNIVSYVGAGP